MWGVLGAALHLGTWVPGAFMTMPVKGPRARLAWR